MLSLYYKQLKQINKMKDSTQYAFKGGQLEPKRRFAVTAVKKMVKDLNFNAELVKSMLDSGVLVKLDSVKPERKTRYHLSPDDLIVSENFVLYAVTGEWSKESTEKLAKVLTDMKYKVIRG